MAIEGDLRVGDRLVDGSGALVKRYRVVGSERRVGRSDQTISLVDESNASRVYENQTTASTTMMPEALVKSRFNRDPLFDKRDAG